MTAPTSPAPCPLDRRPGQRFDADTGCPDPAARVRSARLGRGPRGQGSPSRGDDFASGACRKPSKLWRRWRGPGSRKPVDDPRSRPGAGRRLCHHDQRKAAPCIWSGCGPGGGFRSRRPRPPAGRRDGAASWVSQAQRFRRWYHDQVMGLFETVDIILAPATPCMRAAASASRPWCSTAWKCWSGPIRHLHPADRRCIGLPVPRAGLVGVPAAADRRAGHRARPGAEDVVLQVAHAPPNRASAGPSGASSSRHAASCEWQEIN